MAPTTRASRANWAASHVAALPELWALVAEHSGLVGAWRLTGVCKAARVGAKEWLATLPGLVLCSGYSTDGQCASSVFRLDLGALQWEPISALVQNRSLRACCAVRGTVVVLSDSWSNEDDEDTSATVEILRHNSEAQDSFIDLPPLTCSPDTYYMALAVDESESAEGHVFLPGGSMHGQGTTATAKLDLATGACTPQPSRLYARGSECTAARSRDGRVVCAGGSHHAMVTDENGTFPVSMTAEVLEPPTQGSPDAEWRWRELPRMSVPRYRPRGCVLSDGRFAVFGGLVAGMSATTSCEALTLDGDERWEPLPPMLEPRGDFTCVAVGGCVIIIDSTVYTTAAGGWFEPSIQVYEKALGRWRRLPRNVDHDGDEDYLQWTGGALM
jgi:hypothetical protein